MPNPHDLLKKLADLKQATRLTGTLDDLQVHQLKMWGQIAFQGAKSFYLNWNGEDRSVEYHLDTDVKADAVAPDQMLGALDDSLKNIIGEEWLLTVKANNSVLFVGPRKVPFRAVKELPALAPERGELGPEAEDD